MNDRLILMLEDDPDDRMITEDTLNNLGFDVRIRFVRSSTELLMLLESGVRPFLILTDFNAAPHTALGLLDQLKGNPDYKGIPVVVLGDSHSQKHVAACYQHGASSFVRKPDSMSGTTDKIRAFFEYWLHTVEA